VFAELEQIWTQTLGSPRVAVAILDGPVDLSHPAFLALKIKQAEKIPPPSFHGTSVAGILFGDHGTEIRGIVPQCSAISIPIWLSTGEEVQSCSQDDLAAAIMTAIELGANIINISGGEAFKDGPSPALEHAVAACQDREILIVAAAGNEGCCCPHVPAAISPVLAVGAMDSTGARMPFSNWAPEYMDSGLLALGENLRTARAGGGYHAVTGTSYAAALVSGVAALLTSLQVDLGETPNPLAVRQVLLETADRCDETKETACNRILTGRLNVAAAATAIRERSKIFFGFSPKSVIFPLEQPMETEYSSVEERNAGFQPASEENRSVANVATGVAAAGVNGSDCGCGGGQPSQLVYAIGTIGFDFGSRARQESFVAEMAAANRGSNPYDANALLAHLHENPHAAGDLIWTLNVDGLPIYALVPGGAFASHGYVQLRGLLNSQNTGGQVQRVSVPGVIRGRARLLNSQEIPLVQPALRGVFGWNSQQLMDQALEQVPQDQKDTRRGQFQSFFDRFFHELRNMGVTPSERALNFAGTQIFRLGAAFTAKITGDLVLQGIEVSKSAVCPPGGDCWDVTAIFFHPRQMLDRAREVFRFTVDVSHEIPVRIGQVNSWAAHATSF
jgi:hypothetical protein